MQFGHLIDALRRLFQPTPPPGASCPPEKTPRPLFWLVTVAVVAAGLGAFTLFAHATYPVGPARVTASAAPGDPATTFDLPPLGTVSAPTHASPLALRVSLDQVDVDEVRALALEGLPDEQARTRLIEQLRSGTRDVALRGILAALAAGLLIGLVLRRRPVEVVALAVLGALLPASLLGWAMSDYETRAFERPTFTGALTHAPGVVGMLQHRIRTVADLRSQIETYASQLSAYYSAPQGFASGGAMPDTYRVLVESDLHMDPVGLQLADSLAEEFRADLVLDAGDLGNYGTPLEGDAATRFLDGRRRVFVAGNHESPAIVSAIRGKKSVTVLDDSAVTIDGLRIAGYADPMSRSEDWKQDSELSRRLGGGYADSLGKRVVRGEEPRPDIVLLHDPSMQEPFAGLAPLVISGHTHKARLEQHANTWWLNPGTTGGVMFSKLRPDGHIPHSAAVLYYTKTLPRRLIAIDQIEVYGVDRSSSSLKRTVVDPSLLPKPSAEPTPTVDTTPAKVSSSR